jgi:hypothetical protein
MKSNQLQIDLLPLWELFRPCTRHMSYRSSILEVKSLRVVEQCASDPAVLPTESACLSTGTDRRSSCCQHCAVHNIGWFTYNNASGVFRIAAKAASWSWA